MPKKRTISPEHLAKLQAGRLKKQQEKLGIPPTQPVEPKEDVVEHIGEEQSIDDLKRQVQETQNLLKAFMAGAASNQPQGLSVSSGGRLLGEVEKYLVDPNNYPDPTPRLRKEPRLAPLAFDYNYEMDYSVAVSSYETKTGVNTKEPKFTIALNRIVLDEQGNQTPKRYIARRMVFHEDPQAAIVIARDNGIPIDTNADEKTFLNEMRYLRVRDWLFDIFWPRKAEQKEGLKEEVIGGTIVQVFTKSSEESSGVDFDKITTKF